MLTTEEYSVRKEAFLAYKDTLTKEPSGDVKKEYYVGCVDKEGWDFVDANSSLIVDAYK